MPPQVRHEPLTLPLLASIAVHAFDCGTELWEQEINIWLKAGPGVPWGAYDELDLVKNPAWLHYDDSGNLIGVSSIGPGNASYPKNSNPRIPATCITWLAVDKNHRRKGFGQILLDFILNQAITIYPTFMLIKGLVHTKNPALAWYCNNGNRFIQVGQPKPLQNGLYHQIVRPITLPIP